MGLLFRCSLPVSFLQLLRSVFLAPSPQCFGKLPFFSKPVFHNPVPTQGYCLTVFSQHCVLLSPAFPHFFLGGRGDSKSSSVFLYSLQRGVRPLEQCGEMKFPLFFSPGFFLSSLSSFFFGGIRQGPGTTFPPFLALVDMVWLPKDPADIDFPNLKGPKLATTPLL